MSNDTTDGCITWEQLMEAARRAEPLQPIRPDTTISVTTSYQALLAEAEENKAASTAVDAPCEPVLNVSGYIQIRRLSELIAREKFECPAVGLGHEYDRRTFSLTSEESKAVAGIFYDYAPEYQYAWVDWKRRHICEHPSCAAELIRVTRSFSGSARLNSYGNALVSNPSEMILNPWTVELSTVFGGATILQWLEEQLKKRPESCIHGDLDELLEKRAYKALGPEGFKKRFGYDFIDWWS